MSMHSGVPAKPVVKVGDEVKIGQLIGESGGFVSAPIHASVSGTIKSINDRDPITGEKAISITIASDGKQELYEGLGLPKVDTLQEFLDAVRDSGSAGLGGAGFPTAAKLTIKDIDKLDYILINGAECEPYVTSDTRTMVGGAEYVYHGVKLLQKFFTPKKVYICVEDNKPEAIAKMGDYFADEPDVEVKVLPSLYPQGERKVLVYNVTGRIVPEGARLHDVGCLVMNCTTITVFARYIKLGIPLVQKVVTVDGTAVKTPKNILAPIGTPIKELFDFCDGFVGEPKKIIVGGPMMGIAQPSIEMPVVKTTNAILAFLEKDVKPPKETACIRCGRCVNKCPMSLMPVNIETAYTLKKPEQLKQLHVGMCVECGSCAYICPAKRQLVQVMQLSKNLLWEYKQEQKAAAEKKAAKEVVS
jgi:electron transport complex protein RnfC